MASIIKTLPARFARGQLERFFGIDGPPFCVYYFTLGRGRPKRPDPVTQLYFTHLGRILGHFDITEIVQNKGQLPLLTTLDGEPSEWQIKPDRWVAVCQPPFYPLEDKIFHTGFRGFRYFDLAAYRGTLDSKIPI